MTSQTQWRSHPAAEIFLTMTERELRALADDIKANGQRNPVVYVGEKGERLILDGRNRLRACKMAGVEPKFVLWEGEGGSPVKFVISQNLHRRRLTESQRAMVAAELASLNSDSLTVDEAGSAMAVGRDSTFKARAIAGHGTPELKAAVRKGELSVHAGASIAKLPAAEQNAVVARIEAASGKSAKKQLAVAAAKKASGGSPRTTSNASARS